MRRSKERRKPRHASRGRWSVLSSSTQAAFDNPYGRSKLAAERLLEAFALRTETGTVIYRLPGVFGKWCRPNYNSVVATFCHNIARDIPIEVSNSTHAIELVHVDDVVARFMTHFGDRSSGVTRGAVGPTFTVTLGELAARIWSFRVGNETLAVPDTNDPLVRRLFGTYASYLPLSGLARPIERRSDARGTLAEIIKSPFSGQVFVSRTRPGVTRGNHYHDCKVERFWVLEGDAIIRFRSVVDDEVTEHRVSGTDMKVVDIPPGVTHSIENVGATEMIVLFWASEVFDPDRPDTHFVEVLRGKA